MSAQNPPLIGISSCLLGNKVRYDGQHKLDRYLRDQLGRFVEFVPVCPEVECGLSIPREAMRLVDIEGKHRLMTQKTGIDHTPRMQEWGKEKLDGLEQLGLCGFIFKSRSPSSGMRGVKVYKPDGGAAKSGVGIFARAFMERFPLLPVEDEGRLHDAGLKENFIERIFVFKRWQDIIRQGPSLKGLMDFHADHKLILMAHSPKVLKELGALVAGGKDRPLGELADQYVTTMMEVLKLIATTRKNTNVLEHVMGYFKKQLSSDEKAELKTLIEDYHRGLIPLIVPVTLLNHYVRKYHETYLARQHYLNPHPLELMLRNHV
ncbi:MAG: DUF523 and DUF1722 domain-containing protein [Deltaproteobacteria bacterium]|nr:DUF523 and DUF1722 domain-containing protein [Deltaproteobacteria bacterium]